MASLEALLEAEKRGILPEDKAPLLVEARKRGIVSGDQPQRVESPKAEESYASRIGSAAMRGSIPFGPAGAAVSALREGGSVLDEAFTRGTYGAGGAVTDIAARTGLPPELSAGAGFAANVGLQAIPALLGGKIAPTVAAPMLEDRAKWLMGTALKAPLKDLRTGRAGRAIETLLDEGINVTPGGVEKLRSAVSDLNYQIASEIRSSPAVVNKYDVWSSLKSTLDKFSRQVNPDADTAKLQKVWHEFLNHPAIKNIQDIPVQTAQELKQGTYRVLKGKYGELGSAETEGQKAITRGLKEGIATGVPEVGPLNARESKLLEALDLTERRSLLAANKNPGGLAWLSANPATWAAYLADKSELFKSVAARLAYSGSERVPQTIVGGALTAEQAARSKGE